jgi:hypothetical protein
MATEIKTLAGASERWSCQRQKNNKKTTEIKIMKMKNSLLRVKGCGYGQYTVINSWPTNCTTVAGAARSLGLRQLDLDSYAHIIWPGAAPRQIPASAVEG